VNTSPSQPSTEPTEQTTQEPEPEGDEQQITTDRPLQDSSGLNTSEPSQNGDDEPDTLDPLENLPADLPEHEPAILNLSRGTMVFRFSPDLQDSVDADTVSMLGEFLDSPKNTSNAIVLVEIPQLSENEQAIMITAVTDAFSQHGVAQHSLSFAIYQSTFDGDFYEVRLSFIQPANDK